MWREWKKSAEKRSFFFSPYFFAMYVALLRPKECFQSSRLAGEIPRSGAGYFALGGKVTKTPPGAPRTPLCPIGRKQRRYRAATEIPRGLWPPRNRCGGCPTSPDGPRAGRLFQDSGDLLCCQSLGQFSGTKYQHRSMSQFIGSALGSSLVSRYSIYRRRTCRM